MTGTANGQTRSGNEGKWLLAFPLLILALLVLAPAMTHWQAQKSRAMRYGGCTEAQAETRAARLCRAFGGHPESLSLTVDHTGLKHGFWQAHFENSVTGGSAYELVWEAKTGKLLEISACCLQYPVFSLRGRAAVSDAAIVQAARLWANRLNLATDTAQVRITPLQSITLVTFLTQAEKVEVRLSKDGRLCIGVRVVAHQIPACGVKEPCNRASLNTITASR